MRHTLEHTNVDVGRVQRVPGPSGMIFITVDERGQNMIVVSPGANGKLTPEQLPDDLLEGVALVVMQLEVH